MNRSHVLGMSTRNPLHVTKLLLALGQLTRDLDRLARVFEINDQLLRLRTAADEEAVIADFGKTDAGAAALRDRPRLGRLDLDALMESPADTLGGAYARFLRTRGLTPEALPSKEANGPLEYIVAHYYETHDLWHVLTGFDTDPAGELGVQGFLLAQSRSYLPLFLMAAILLNTAIYAYDDRVRRLDALARGWTLGRAARSLVGVDWRAHLRRPLDEVRADFGLGSAP
jgi:ubiquinone biosynthesis protein COQ4